MVDSEPLHKRAKELAFDEIGVFLAEDVDDSYKGRPDRTMMPEVPIAPPVPPMPNVGSSGTGNSRSRSRTNFKAMDGAAEFVRRAATRFRLALDTSAQSPSGVADVGD